MTTRPLLDELRRAATEEMDAARRRARSDADAARAAAHTAAGRVAAEARRAHAHRAVEAAAVAQADALRANRETLLPARAAALDRVFRRASACVEARAGHPELADALAPLVRDALAFAPEDGARVRCAPGLVAAVRNSVDRAGRANARVVPDPGVPLGVVVESADGAIVIDATFARRLLRSRGALATQVARALAKAAT